jgi:hypothetical protein
LVKIKGLGFALVSSRKRWFLEGAEYATLEALFGEFRKEANFLNEADPSANGPVNAASTTDIRRM